MRLRRVPVFLVPRGKKAGPLRLLAAASIGIMMRRRIQTLAIATDMHFLIILLDSPLDNDEIAVVGMIFVEKYGKGSWRDKWQATSDKRLATAPKQWTQAQKTVRWTGKYWRALLSKTNNSAKISSGRCRWRARVGAAIVSCGGCRDWCLLFGTTLNG